RAERGKLIHIEPRMSPTSAAADQWVPVNPGREGELALAIGNAIIEEGGVPEDRIAAYKSIFASDALESVDDSNLGVSHDTIHDIAVALGHGPALVIGGGSAGAHTNGTFNLTAIYALNVLLGSVGVPGGVIYNPESPVEDLPSSSSGASFETWEKELAQWRAGNVGTVILRQANLVHGLPRSVNVPQALENVEHVVAFADVLDDTSALADLVLPEASYLESWAMDIPEPGPGYQTVGIQQPVVTPARTRDGATILSDARSFGDVLLGAADGALGANSMQDLVEDAASKLFDLNRSSSSVKAYNSGMFLRGTLQRGGWWDTESGVNSAVPSSLSSVSPAAPKFSSTESGVTEEFFLMPFASTALGDGKFAAAPWAQATPDPITSATWVTWVEINHDVADRLGIEEGDEIAIRSTTGEIVALAYPHRAAAPNILGVPIGQGNENSGRWAEGRGSNVLSILVDQKDSETGALAWASTRVRISRLGTSQKMTKLEGTVEAIAIEPQFPIVVVEPGESAEDAIHHAHEEHDMYADEK
ncbi:MAG: molybdopterin-dependent oxidoreductase, partial [Planctomycetota bacterium]|nr:molybdopterin-dependent oxidoreductase [Planctomycetota bacterium]